MRAREGRRAEEALVMVKEVAVKVVKWAGAVKVGAVTVTVVVARVTAVVVRVAAVRAAVKLVAQMAVAQAVLVVAAWAGETAEDLEDSERHSRLATRPRMTHTRPCLQT